MVLKQLCLGKTLVAVSLFFASTLGAWGISVRNDTPFNIEAKCKKVGAISNAWATILPLTSGSAGCGGADCPNGLDVKVTVAGTNQVINLTTSFDVACSNINARVFLVPQYDKNNKVTGFKVALGIDVDVSDIVVPA